MGNENVGQYPGSGLVGPNLEITETATVSTAGPVTLTVAQVFNKIYVRETGAAARSDTTPTARALINAIAGAHIGATFMFIVRNVSAAAHNVTIVGGTGVTLQGSADTSQSTQTIYLGYVTAVGTTPTLTLTNFNTSTLVIGGTGATNSITAFAGGGQTSATAMTSTINRVTTVATAADSVRLPAATAGRAVTVTNSAALSMQVFGATTDTINGVATATGVPQPAGTTVRYVSPADGTWYAFNFGTSSTGYVGRLYDELNKPGFEISPGTVSSVNYVTAFNSATGDGTNNGVGIGPVGTDTHIALTLLPKGTNGEMFIGLSTGTGTIRIGQSSGAQTVVVGNGAGVATVSVAQGGTAGNTVNIAGAATATGATDTVNIATGNTAGTGAKTVHIADGTPGGTGIHTVTIGAVSNLAHVTTIQGGNGSSAIKLTPQTTGVITVGAAAGTGDVVVGSSSATQIVKIGNGAGVATVNLANVSVAGANVNIATAVTGAGITDTVAISTGNAAATGIKVVNIATGTPGTSGNNRVTIGGGATSKFSVNAVFTTATAANYIATESGSNNAIAGALTDASGVNVALAAGLRVIVQLAHSLQAGANTFVFNGTSKNIKSHFNVANNIATAYAATGAIELLYDGVQFVDCSQ